MQATAAATSNIALVKYWGKRDVALNLPATGSISVTLDRLTSRTTVRFDAALDGDVFRFDGEAAPAMGRRVSGFLDLVRGLADTDLCARVETSNDFPTGAGLASSASGFAALALACDEALGMNLSSDQLSALARRGSGSAARSLIGGFAEMRPGVAADGRDAYAVELAPPTHVAMQVLVAITTTAGKSVGSTEGMRRTEETSPFYAPWLDATRADLDCMRAAITDADLERIGELAESNALRMHAVMLGARPPLLYWTAATVRVMRAVQAMRGEGLAAWFTIDAGPQVKVLCAPSEAEDIEARLRGLEGVHDVVAAAPGEGPRVLETRP